MPDNLTLLDVASDALVKDLKTALSAPLELLRSLASSLDRERGFRIRDERQAIKSWTSAGLSAATLSDTVSVLRHLLDHGISSEKTPQELIEELRSLCTARNLTGFQERSEILQDILTPSDMYLERRTVLPWTRNALPYLAALDAAAELRGVFQSADSDEVLGLIPMAILRIALKHDDDERSQIRRIGMQLTEEDIDELIDTLQLAKRRLSALGEHVRESHATIYEQSVRGQWKSSRSKTPEP